MKKRFFKTSLIYSTIALACSPAYAELFQLGQIEVVAEKSADISTVNIVQADLRKNEQTNVAEVAKTTAGVFFERKGSRAEQNIVVRGFGATRVPVFIDGIPVYVPYDGNMDLGRFTTFDLARIDISKGSSSILYGANTMGGAINLISQKPSKAFEGTLGYGYQSGRNAHTARNQTYFNLGTKQDRFYAQVSGSFVEQQGLQLSHKYQPYNFNVEQGGRAENSVQRDKRISIKLAYTPNESDEYALSFSSQRGSKQQPLYTGNVAGSRARDWRWPAWNKDSLYFLSHTQFAPYNLYVNSKAFYDRFTNQLNDYADSTFQNIIKQSHYRDYSFGAGIEVGADLTAKNSTKMTALYKADVHREHNDNDPVAVDKDRTYSLGLENTYRFTDYTKLITGVSYDYRDAVRAENYQEIQRRVKGIYQFAVGSQHAFNYQIKLTHSFDGNDELSLGFAKKTHLPTMKDRYSRRLGRNEENPFLQPETAYHYELGYWRSFSNWLKLEGALFQSEVKDAIESIKQANGKEKNLNYGKEVFKGVELAASIFASENFTLGANYTYLRAKNRNDRSYIIKDVPKHKAFVYVDWQITPALDLYLSQETESGRYSTNGMGANSHLSKLSGFSITNVKLSYQFNDQLSASAGVHNLFDKNYYYAAGYPEQGRVYFSNVKYQF